MLLYKAIDQKIGLKAFIAIVLFLAIVIPAAMMATRDHAICMWTALGTTATAFTVIAFVTITIKMEYPIMYNNFRSILKNRPNETLESIFKSKASLVLNPNDITRADIDAALSGAGIK